jgi:hypothetical protein
VFKLSPPVAAGGAWTETVLDKFMGSDEDGSGPASTPTAPAISTGTTIEGGARKWLGVQA